MKAVYQVTDKLTFEVDASSDVEMFEKLAMLDKIFGIDVCSPTKSKNLKFVVHEAQGNKFYEIHDKDNPKYRMKFGVRKVATASGKLFPKKQPNGYYWFTWNGADSTDTDDSQNNSETSDSTETLF